MAIKKFWSVTEDKYFLKTVISVVGEKSGTLNEAFEIVSKKLGRTFAGCQARYKNTIKNEVPQEILDKISANNPKNASQQGLAQLKKETVIQDVDEFDDDDEVDEQPDIGIDEVVDEVDEVDEIDEVDKEVDGQVDEDKDDFSDIQSLVVELLKLDARRKIIKARVKKYQDFINGVLSDT